MPHLTLAEMNDLGIAVTIFPGATLRVTIQAVYDLAVALRPEGPAAEARFSDAFKHHPLGDLHTFAGFDQIRGWEEESLPAEDLEKYASPPRTSAAAPRGRARCGPGPAPASAR